MTVSPNTGLTAALPQTALTSPYDGTSPALAQPGLGAQSPYVASPGGYGVPTLTGNTGSSPQVNATNQTAIAPNGDVNQSVTNQNQYTNKYYNIIVPNGALGGVGNLFGGSGGGLGGLFGSGGNSFIDPKTGVLYVQRDTGITGWFKRLFSGGY
jgi:hypothetical protein